MPPKSPIPYTSEKSLATLQIVRLRSGECVPVTDLSDSEIIEIALVHVDMGYHQQDEPTAGPPKAATPSSRWPGSRCRRSCSRKYCG
jgi:hypothetical protein